MPFLRILLSIVIYCTSLGVSASESAPRIFEFEYELLDTAFPPGKAVDIYIPLPVQGSGQRILRAELDTSIPGEAGVEARYGNRYYHIHRDAGDDTPLTGRLSWIVERNTVRADAQPLTAEDRARYLAPNSLVPVGHEILKPILAEIHQMRADETPAATARAIYDWVVDNVEYKKVGTGWGNGDTFWACTERYGNCTDFHALFISLARSEGIPARFEIGFPIPENRASGIVGGYHCWVRFYLPGEGWVPIDASEAAKHPQMKELLFGTHPADRIHFSTGRDLTLTEGSHAQTLNYFIYPHVEVDGRAWKGKVATRFRYREAAPAVAATLLTQDN